MEDSEEDCWTFDENRNLPSECREEPSYVQDGLQFGNKIAVDSRLGNKWARWLCPALLQPEWISSASTTAGRFSTSTPRMLPMPSNSTESILLAIIFKKLLPPSIFPPAVSKILAKLEQVDNGTLVSGTGSRMDTATVSALRRVLEEGIKMLKERIPEQARLLPLPSLVLNGATSAALQVLSACKAIAMQKIRRELGAMLRWYSAAGQLYRSHLHIPSNPLRGPNTTPSQQMWSLFRSGTLLCCALHAITIVPTKNPPPKASSAIRIDIGQVYGKPRKVEELVANLENAFTCMDRAGLPRMWDAVDFVGYPDGDDTFLLIQTFSLYQALSEVLPLKRLERAAREEQPPQRWVFRDMARIQAWGADGRTWRWEQSQRCMAAPVLVVNMQARELRGPTSGGQTRHEGIGGHMELILDEGARAPAHTPPHDACEEEEEEEEEEEGERGCSEEAAFEVVALVSGAHRRLAKKKPRGRAGSPARSKQQAKRTAEASLKEGKGWTDSLRTEGRHSLSPPPRPPWRAGTASPADVEKARGGSPGHPHEAGTGSPRRRRERSPVKEREGQRKEIAEPAWTQTLRGSRGEQKMSSPLFSRPVWGGHVVGAQRAHADEGQTKVLTITIEELMGARPKPAPDATEGSSRPSPPRPRRGQPELASGEQGVADEARGPRSPRGNGTAAIAWRVLQLQASVEGPGSTNLIKMRNSVEALRSEVAALKRRLEDWRLIDQAEEECEALEVNHALYSQKLEEPNIQDAENSDCERLRSDAAMDSACQPLEIEDEPRRPQPQEDDDHSIQVYSPAMGEQSTIMMSPDSEQGTWRSVTRNPFAAVSEGDEPQPHTSSTQPSPLSPPRRGVLRAPSTGASSLSMGFDVDDASPKHKPRFSFSSSSPDASEDRGREDVGHDSNDEGTWKVSFPGKEDLLVQGQCVAAARLNKAVEIVTTADNVVEDDELMMAVVLMHRSVATSLILLRKLISRFHLAQGKSKRQREFPLDVDGEIAVVRHKVCSVILVWLRDFYRDFSDQELVRTLNSFLGLRSGAGAAQDAHAKDSWLPEQGLHGSEADWSSLMLVKDVMRRVLVDRISMISSQDVYLNNSTQPSDAWKHKEQQQQAQGDIKQRVSPVRSWTLMHFSSADIAHQLTLDESRLFFAISYRDFLDCGCLFGGGLSADDVDSLGSPIAGGEKCLPPSSPLRKFIESGRNIAAWVSSTIVSEVEHRSRVAQIAFFISVADACLQVNNFSTMMSIWRGLQSRPVRRLLRANAEALNDSNVLTIYAYVSQLASKSDDFRGLCDASDVLQDTPCVPFLHSFLRDLTRIHRESGEDVLDGGLLNLDKARMLATTLKQIVRHQCQRRHAQR